MHPPTPSLASQFESSFRPVRREGTQKPTRDLWKVLVREATRNAVRLTRAKGKRICLDVLSRRTVLDCRVYSFGRGFRRVLEPAAWSRISQRSVLSSSEEIGMPLR